MARQLQRAGHQVLDAFVKIGGKTFDRAYVYQLRGIIAALTVVETRRRNFEHEGESYRGTAQAMRDLWDAMLLIEPARQLVTVARHDKTLVSSGLQRIALQLAEEPLPLFGGRRAAAPAKQRRARKGKRT